ncbi:hypothetical protein BGW37DRAFT_202525 [Umbelopsis sp. PMI_123]|nr:hypothetical protein BGW37DRAFT_202525 [Umbelopsis sp. PMI_123]
MAFVSQLASLSNIPSLSLVTRLRQFRAAEPGAKCGAHYREAKFCIWVICLNAFTLWCLLREAQTDNLIAWPLGPHWLSSLLLFYLFNINGVLAHLVVQNVCIYSHLIKSTKNRTIDTRLLLVTLCSSLLLTMSQTTSSRVPIPKRPVLIVKIDHQEPLLCFLTFCGIL